jgi:hypothetical protein
MRLSACGLTAGRKLVKDLLVAVPGHARPEAIAEKRELDLRKVAPKAAVLAVDHLGLLGMQL